MEQSNKAFSEALVKSLRGERGHLPIKNALSDIDVALAENAERNCLILFIN